MIRDILLPILIIDQIKKGNDSEQKIIRKLLHEEPFLTKNKVGATINEMLEDGILIKEISGQKFLKINFEIESELNSLLKDFYDLYGKLLRLGKIKQFGYVHNLINRLKKENMGDKNE